MKTWPVRLPEIRRCFVARVVAPGATKRWYLPSLIATEQYTIVFWWIWMLSIEYALSEGTDL